MQSLCGTWKLALDPDDSGRKDRWFDKVRAEAQDAPVPGIVQQVFPLRFGVAWYWTTFQPLRTAETYERYQLAFEAVDYKAEVWVNGQTVGGYAGGEMPFQLDVTAAVRPGQDNLIAVRILTPTDDPIDGIRLTQVPNRNKRMQGYVPGVVNNWGGILRPVELRIVPAVRIADVFVRPDPHTGRIRTAVTVHNDTPAVANGRLTATVAPAFGGELLDTCRQEFACPTGDSVHEMDLTIAQPRLWNLDDPSLYRVQVRFEAGVHSHERTVRCGFRELRVEHGYFRLNGKRIFLRSTHTGNHFPVTWVVAQNPDLVRRDLLMAKAAGYNTVRFITSTAYPEQLDCCDEIGLMIYEESLAAWGLEDSPDMSRLYDFAVSELVRRDRNHPCVTIWGLLNEIPDSPVFRQAVKALGVVRAMDDTRLVLLNSGRFDQQIQIGSLCNPRSTEWECQWGSEGPAAAAPQSGTEGAFLALTRGGCDVHIYPSVPHDEATCRLLRNLGRDSKPVFLSEYGIGSLLNVIRGTRWFEQLGARPDLVDAAFFRTVATKLEADWKTLGFEGTYPFAEDMLRDSERLHTRQRLLGFDLIRSNPKICGFNVTGMLDHGLTGEGVWTFWREWKPGIADAFCDGFAPLRWCLFVDPLHGYAGRKITLEAVLANEDVLGPGEYPVCLRVAGHSGIVWQRRVMLRIPVPSAGEEAPLALPVFRGAVKLDAPAGEYEFAAYMERGGAPFGGRLKFRLAGPPTSSKIKRAVRLWGVDKDVAAWLKRQGVRCKPFEPELPGKPEVILVGQSPEDAYVAERWQTLARQMAQGSCVIFASPLGLRSASPRPRGGRIELVGRYPVVERDFPVANVPKAEWPIYSREWYGAIHFRASGLPAGDYVVEIGMCEGFKPEPGHRVFNLLVNGRRVLENFDLVKEAGGWHRAVTRRFPVRTRRGQIDIQAESIGKSEPSVSQVRILDAQGTAVLAHGVLQESTRTLPWLPLVEKGQLLNYTDWLYHKECVAKAHPIFNSLQAKGIMDWDFYGPVIDQKIFDGLKTPDDAAAAAFATSGYPVEGGYVSGLMIASYPFGAGRFILNTFRVLENIDRHPAADRLLLNMLDYGAGFVKPRPGRLPANFDRVLRAIGYMK